MTIGPKMSWRPAFNYWPSDYEIGVGSQKTTLASEELLNLTALVFLTQFPLKHSANCTWMVWSRWAGISSWWVWTRRITCWRVALRGIALWGIALGGIALWGVSSRWWWVLSWRISRGTMTMSPKTLVMLIMLVLATSHVLFCQQRTSAA